MNTISEDEDTDNDQEMNTDLFDVEEFEANIKQSRDQLSQNPNDYTSHLNVVNALSHINYINPFRKARDKMSRKFAIPPSVSIHFINLEIEYLYYLFKDNSPNIQDISIVTELFDNAIADYSVDMKLWTNYLQFVFQFESIIGIDAIRKNIISKAIRTIGQHFYDGHNFWTLYREFETHYLAALITKQNKDDTPDIIDIDGIQSDDDNDDNLDGDNANYAVSKQTELIRNIWRQQIQIPHFQIEVTYRNYQEWETAVYGQTSSEYKPKYNTSKKLSKHFKEWEQKLQGLTANVSPGYASVDRLNLWKHYIADIAHKIKNIKPKSMQSLYERAISDCFLHETIWREYIEWIKSHDLKFEIISVCARSIRNIPLSAHLWSEYIYAAQWTELDINDVNHRIFARFVFPIDPHKSEQLQRQYKIKKDEIIDFGSDTDKYIFIAIAKCEYYRMRARCSFDERYEDEMNEEEKDKEVKMKEAETVFDEVAALIDANISSSWSITFYKFYIDFISRFVGNIAKARGLWEKLLKMRGKEWNLWCDFIEWESTFGETQAVVPSKRKQGTKAHNAQNRKIFGQSNIYQIRHLFHRAIFILDIESSVQYIGERLISFERKCGDLQSLKNAKIRLEKKLKELQIRKQRNEAKRLKTNKRKRSEYADNKRYQKNDDEDKSTKYASNTKDAVIQEIEAKKLKTKHERTKPQYIEMRQRSDPNYMDADAKGTKEERTVFVVNLRPTMTRKDVKIIFEKFGKLENMKLPNSTKEKHKHKLRGIGWIEYKHKENAIKCIEELHGASVQGKILRVERYRNRANNENTVYIKGLPKHSETEAMECIQSVLAKCGEIKEIRLTREKYDARTKSKRVKGFAYVEFVKHESVAVALKCDKCVYKERIIEVLPYVTEGKRQKGQKEKGQKEKKKEKKKEHTMDVDEEVHKTSELVNKLGFVPRSISSRKSHLKTHSETNKSNTNKSNTNMKQFDKEILNKSNKSQDDFRKLFNI